MASTAVVTRDFLPKRGHGMATRARVPALLEFESPTAALVQAPVKPAARSILWTVVSAIFASYGGFRPVSDRYGGERRRPCRVASGDQRRAAA